MKTVSLPERGDTFRLFNNLATLTCYRVSVTIEYNDRETGRTTTYTTSLDNISDINSQPKFRGTAAASVPEVTFDYEKPPRLSRSERRHLARHEALKTKTNRVFL